MAHIINVGGRCGGHRRKFLEILGYKLKRKVKKKARFLTKTGFSHFLLVEISGIEPLTS